MPSLATTLSALSHTPEGVGFFGREKVCEECASIGVESWASEDRSTR